MGMMQMLFIIFVAAIVNPVNGDDLKLMLSCVDKYDNVHVKEYNFRNHTKFEEILRSVISLEPYHNYSGNCLGFDIEFPRGGDPSLPKRTWCLLSKDNQDFSDDMTPSIFKGSTEKNGYSFRKAYSYAFAECIEEIYLRTGDRSVDNPAWYDRLANYMFD